MDIYKLKFTRLQNEIFRILCVKSGQFLNQRVISKLLKVSPTAVSKSVPLLEKEGLINIKRDKNLNLNYISLNRDDETVIGFKRAENLRMVYESGLVDSLKENLPGVLVILFGSYSFGEDIFLEEADGHNSDIDIAIVGAKGKEIDLRKFEKILERRIFLNFYPSFSEIHKDLKDNLLNGIILSGSIDL